MKRSGPDPLRQALARSQQAERHPDSDLLTAFAEGTLLLRERRDLLEHLAACSACREVLSISASASATFAEEVKPYLLPWPKHPPLRSWLPWVAAAAGVVVVSSAVLIRQERKPVLTPPAQVATVDQKKVERLAQPTVPPPAVTPSMKVKSAKPAPASVEGPAALVPPSTARTMVAPREQVMVADTSDQVSAGQPTAVAPAKTTTATGGVQGAAPAPSAAALGKVSQRHNAFGTMSATAVRPHWRINESGQVERSFGEEVWQPLLTDERSKMRVVSVFGSDVWVGGEQSRLFHSADNGTTWNSVNLPSKDGLIHVITHIRFQTQKSGTVEAEDGSSWTTGDAGRTWN